MRVDFTHLVRHCRGGNRLDGHRGFRILGIEVDKILGIDVQHA